MCDYCGGPLNTSIPCQSSCTAIYCSLGCRASDFRDHSQICSPNSGGDTRVRNQLYSRKPQPQRQQSQAQQYQFKSQPYQPQPQHHQSQPQHHQFQSQLHQSQPQPQHPQFQPQPQHHQFQSQPQHHQFQSQPYQSKSQHHQFHPQPQHHQFHPQPQHYHPQPKPQHPQFHYQPFQSQAQPQLPQFQPHPTQSQSQQHQSQNHQPQQEYYSSRREYIWSDYDSKFQNYKDGNHETKTYNSRTFYRSNYGGNYRNYDTASTGPSYTRPFKQPAPSRHTVGDHDLNSINNNAQSGNKVENVQTMQPTEVSVPKPAVEIKTPPEKVKPPVPTTSIKPPVIASNSNQKKPTVRKVSTQAKSKKAHNLFSVLKETDSCSEEESEEDEEEDLEIDVEEVPITSVDRSGIDLSDQKTRPEVLVESPGTLTDDQKKADVPRANGDEVSNKLTKGEKKRLKKQRQKEKAAMSKEKITKEEYLNEKKDESKPLIAAPSVESRDPVKDKKAEIEEEAMADVPGSDGQNFSKKDTKEEKKKLKKQRQKEKAAQQIEDKFMDYLSSVKKEISLRHFEKAKILILEAFKLSTLDYQRRDLYELRYKLFLTEEKYDHALKDLKKLIEIDPKDRDGLKAAIDCCLKTGNVKEFHCISNLCRDCKFGFLLTAREKMEQLEELQSVARQKERGMFYSEAANALFKALQLAPYCLKIIYWLAKLQALDMKPGNARQTLKQTVRVSDKVQPDPNSESQQNFILGICSYYEGDIRSSETRFKLAQTNLKAAEEWFVKTKKLRTMIESADSLINLGRYDVALDEVQKALEFGEGNKKHTVEMLEKKANIYYLKKDFEASRDYYDKALDIDPNSDESLYYRGKIHLELGDYDSAVRDLTEALRLYPCYEYESELSRAEKLLKKSLETGGTDYYDVLGVDKSADIQTIKKAFKKKALEYHPDKHSHSTKEVQEEMEKKMKELSAAYSCLSDDQKKKMYDAGTEDSGDEDDDLIDILLAQFFESMMGGARFFSFTGQPNQRSRRRK